MHFYTTLHFYVNIHVGNHNSPPSSAEPMYEEVGVVGEVKRSQEIQLIFNEAYVPVVKDSNQASAECTYGQIDCEVF